MSHAPEWKVHTTHLLQEIVINPNMWALRTPVLIFRQLLAAVATRAIELDDPELNRLMLRLALYEQGDPTSPAYDPSLLREEA